MSGSDLSLRLPVVLIGGPLILALTFAGGVPFVIVVLALVVRGQWEVLELFEPEGGFGPARYAALLAGIVILADGGISGGHNWYWLLPAATGVVLLLVLFGSTERGAIGAVGGAAVSWLYVVIPLTHLLWLRYPPGGSAAAPGGAWIVVSLWLVVWMYDTVAYLVGSAWGRHKLLPSVSPNKSWEGTVAGVAAAAATGLLLAALVGGLRWSVAAGAALGFVLGLGALAGDLIESRLKRGAGRKDTGTLLLGHGGVLDRFDSTLVCAPLLYYLLPLLGGGHVPG